MDPWIISLIILMSLAGSLAGTFTGITPGIHVNMLASLMLISYPSISSAVSLFAELSYVPVIVCAFIMSASVVHSFVDFVPSVFTGAPDPDDTMSMLPGHRLLMSGKGMSAVRSAAIGSTIGTGCALLLAIPVQYILMNGLGKQLDVITFSVLAFALSIMVINEEGHRLWALMLIALSGILGFVCMNGNLPCSGIFGDNTLLFPLLSGLFGIPALLSSTKKTKIPKQYDTVDYPVNSIPGIKGVLVGCLAGWYPGITSTAGASIASAIIPEKDPARFISLVASIGTVTTVFSLVTLSISGSGRSGTVLVIKEIVGNDMSGFCSETFLLMLLSIAIGAMMGYWLTICSGHLMCKIANDFDLGAVNKVVIVLVVTLVFLLTGPFGIAILFISTVIGYIPISLEMGRTPLTGCLMVPVMLSQVAVSDILISMIA